MKTSYSERGRFLKMRKSDLEGQIALGKLELTQDKGRGFIELEALKAYVAKRRPKES